MDSSSGIITEETVATGEHFSDFTPIPCKGFNTLCKAKRYGRWWVLKGLKPQYARQEMYRSLLKKEFDILISLQHPGIVGAASFEYVAGIGYCIVMEWIDGITLEEWISRGYNRADSDKLIMQMLDAIGYVHKKQIVHRDLKPQNIMVTHNGGNIKLIDFGLADTDSYTILKQPAGTPGYISPEQASSRQTDIRNDIFSIGCILEKMSVGREYAHIIRRCKGDINRRYASAEEIKEEIVAIGEKKQWMKSRIGYAAIAMAAASVFTLYYIRHDTGKETENAENSLQQRLDTINTQPKTHQTKDIIRIQERKSNDYAAEASSQRIISEGKEAIDKMWRDSGIDTISQTERKSETLYEFVERSNAFITTTYPNTFGTAIAGSQKTYIINELSAYTAEKYIKPTLKRFQSDT